MKILVFDNYDSFTYNLVHLLEKVSDANVDVYKNDKIELEQVAQYDKILLSPGPGLPAESGILNQLISTYASTKSIFGVCLGLQAIGEVFGARLKNLDEVYHGIATDIHVKNKEHIFQSVPSTFKAGRYHSWVIDNESVPQVLEVTATDEQGMIMAAQHKTYDVRGVQFHPESILSEYGEEIIANWLKI